MANMNLDFSNVRSNEPLDEGMYSVVIEAVEPKTSSTGKEMLLVRFREVETGTTIFENYLLQENCLWKLKELLTAAGLECEGMCEIDTDALVGLEFKAKITVEDYNDSKVNRIKKVYAA